MLRGFGFDLRSSSSLRLGILLGNSDCTSEIGAEGRGTSFFPEFFLTLSFVLIMKKHVFVFFWRFGSFRKWQPWIWIASRWSTGGEEFAKFALMGPMHFSLRKSAGMGTSRGVRGRSSLAREWASLVWDFRRTAMTRSAEEKGINQLQYLLVRCKFQSLRLSSSLVRTSRNRKRQPVGHHWWRALWQSGCTSDLQVSVVWWFGMTNNLPDSPETIVLVD